MSAGMLDVLKDVTDRLEQESIEYFLVGSMASMYYGRPRFTQDIDLVVRIKARHIPHFEKLFPIEDYYCPPIEVLQDEVSRKGSFNLIHQGSGIKVDIILDAETSFSASEFSRKKKVEMAPGIEVYIASAEDIILKKLDYYREGESEKHLSDIREIIMSEKVDNSYIEEWSSRMGLEKYWEKV
ncbi:MAG: hypothetical protein H6626_14410 [Pseudobdellovibrionaceae bacterium]|nr:MAG: hypothetical protein H6626_14410 [Pseudobdellovibrionaceae bacterium]